MRNVAKKGNAVFVFIYIESSKVLSEDIGTLVVNPDLRTLDFQDLRIWKLRNFQAIIAL